MTEFDDFPTSPDCWADSHAFYQAFLKGEEFIESLPPKERGANPDRLTHEMTSHLYGSRMQSKTLLRAPSGAAIASSATWLSRVRILAEWFAAANEFPRFEGLRASDLQAWSKLSANVDELNSLPQRLLARGIILVHEPAIPGAKVDGAVFTLMSGTPVIGMSLRYPRLDSYWFTLMHELAHVVLHKDQLSSPIIDDLDEESPELTERQADKLASDSLIPRNEWRTCPARSSLSDKDILEFSARLHIAPQIVAGRLRRELRRYHLFAPIVNAVNVREVLTYD